MRMIPIEKIILVRLEKKTNTLRSNRFKKIWGGIIVTFLVEQWTEAGSSRVRMGGPPQQGSFAEQTVSAPELSASKQE